MIMQQAVDHYNFYVFYLYLLKPRNCKFPPSSRLDTNNFISTVSKNVAQKYIHF